MNDVARPRILVTARREVTKELWDDYARAVHSAGGQPVPFVYDWGVDGDRVPPHDGLVTIGGFDVDPRFYHERLQGSREMVAARDVAEIELTLRALDERRPLLAICRGMQVLNVACGGSLHQHIEPRAPHHGAEETGKSGWHGVQVTPGTLLASIAGAGPLRVNSRHHQAVTPERLAPGLVACGRTDEGGLTVIEAIEVSGHPFALGVQWHPEREEQEHGTPAFRDTSMALFAAFVEACRASAR